MESSPQQPIPNNDEQDDPDRRWPRKRGGYKIEKQCSVCKWWFDSFDPERKTCHKCPKGDPQPPPVNASMLNPNLLQSAVPRALPNPWQLFDMSGVENMQLDNTQYRAYGQGYGTTFDPGYPSGTLPSLSAGYNMPNQMREQGYDMSLGSSDFSGTMSGLAGIYTQDQPYGQGYITSPDLSDSSFSATLSDPLGEYMFSPPIGCTPDQQWGQDYNMPVDPSYSFGTLPYPISGYMESQTSYQGEGSSFSSPPQEPNQVVKPNEAGATASKLRPLRPLLPSILPKPDDGDGDDDDDDNQPRETTAYQAWLKSQGVPIKKVGRSSKKNASGTKKHKSPKSSKSHQKKK
ncbi:hypothetical protein F4859DRAFT_520286 [Xylaria cf. heliscus]|nr:hypothetical protein F4859DRAFT_520286 [Xylaria cf. heliscus]